MTRIRRRSSSATSFYTPIKAHQPCTNGLVDNDQIPAGAEANPLQDPRQSAVQPPSLVIKDCKSREVTAKCTNGYFLGTRLNTLYCSKPYVVETPHEGKQDKIYQDFQRLEAHSLHVETKYTGAQQQGQKNTHISPNDIGGAAVHCDNHRGSCAKQSIEVVRVSRGAGSSENGGKRPADAYCNFDKQRNTLEQIGEDFHAPENQTDTDDDIPNSSRKVLPLKIVLDRDAEISAASKARYKLDSETVQMPLNSRSRATSSLCITQKRSLHGKLEDKTTEAFVDHMQTASYIEAYPSGPSSISKISDAEKRAQLRSSPSSGTGSNCRWYRADQLPGLRSSWRGQRRRRSSALYGGLTSEYNSGDHAHRNAEHCFGDYAQRDADVRPLSNMNIRQVLRNKDYMTLPIISEELRAVFQLQNEKLIDTRISAFPIRNMYRMDDCSEPTHLPLERERDSGVLAESPQCIRKSCQSTLICDSMRCRRKNGRRWRCRDEVVRAGAAFCHYHAQKISEKRGRKTSANSTSGPPGAEQDGQNDVEACREDSEVSLNHMFQSASKRRTTEKTSKVHALMQRPLGSNPKVQYMTGRLDDIVAANGKSSAKQEAEQPGTHRNEKVGSRDELDNKHKEAPAAKGRLQIQKSSMLRKPKKRKHCLRRLHEVMDRSMAQTVAAGGARSASASQSSVWVAQRSFPPFSTVVVDVPECRLNTDPCEWRPDFC
ncbi:hypothetical protein KP509_25G030200 [Ceratopteris richardii]|uniref:WRC domain-containing protein n=1 Tax=Ceratopteris richardii TaxID=49495 RepID=A0A8T2RNV9_CERRI|nr:hypothetical protein KP509_25G030200 [Ceratopteris richardii]